MSISTPAVQPAGATESVAQPTTDDVVVVRRRTIDSILTGAGALLVVVLVVAGSLLTWGKNFSHDYVHRELASQNIKFPDEAALLAEDPPRTDLVKYAGQSVTNGNQAEAYASFINGHLQHTADGKTYADLGAVQSAARAELKAAQDAGKDEATIADLQAKVTTITTQRETLFKGETLRGLLLTTFAWSTIGRIAGIAAVVAFVAAGLMLVLTVLGAWHRHRVAKGTA